MKAAQHDVEAGSAMLRQFTGQTGTGGGGCYHAPLPYRRHVLRVHQESEALVPAGTPLIEIGQP